MVRSTSPILNILGRIIVSVTIKVATYLFNWEVEVNLFGSHVEDCIGGVEERSSQNDRCIVIFLHVKNQEIWKYIIIFNLYHDVLHYAF
jgi:hypothetical protein